VDRRPRGPDATLPATLSFIDALEKLANGAKFNVAVFELNANSHGMRRGAGQRPWRSRPSSGNGPDRRGGVGQCPPAGRAERQTVGNQGLLFLDPAARLASSRPAMSRKLFAPPLPAAAGRVAGWRGVKDDLDVTATRSEDGKTLVLSAVNPTDHPVAADVVLTGYAPTKDPGAGNRTVGTIDRPQHGRPSPTAVASQEREWSHGRQGWPGPVTRFPPRSVTFIRWE